MDKEIILKTINVLSKNKPLLYIVVIIIIIFCFWFYFGKKEKSQQEIHITNSKNVNTGVNKGNIGDVYTGIKQRYFTKIDSQNILNEISEFKNKNIVNINKTHISIGVPGDKESKNLADQAIKILTDAGYKVQIWSGIFGSIGKMYDISYAPDSSIMLIIYPADNVQ